MHKLYIKNTLGRNKEEFKPINNKEVSFYHCGPTVYWDQHIGNLRGMMCADIVVRTLRYIGYKVKHIRNYTDVGHLTSDGDYGEDKMQKGAIREKKTPKEIADKYIKVFENDTKELNIEEPFAKPRVTECIKEIIDMVSVLIEKKYAYVTDLAVYFDVSKVDDYGKLSGQKLDNLFSGAGTGEVVDTQKKNSFDFALWFFKAGNHEKAIQYWASPFVSKLVKNGNGFPGWHIECSAMIKKFLGDTIDIHMGGIEHIPVHHTNEIAQSESANGVKFVNYWLHNEFLLFGNEKIAKSSGSKLTLAVVKEQGYNPLSLRYLFLQANYRAKQNFTWEALESADKGLNHMRNQIKNLGTKVGEVNKEYKDKFINCITNDFNISEALSVAVELLKSDIKNEDKLATIFDFDRVFGLDLKNKQNTIKLLDGLDNSNLDSIKLKSVDNELLKYEIESDFDITNEIREIIKERQIARINKEWEKSDRLRDDIQKRFKCTIEDAKYIIKIYKKV